MESPNELTLYLAFLIEQHQARGATLRDIGQRWGVTHAAVAILRKHLRGGAMQMAIRVANVEAGGSFDELRRRAETWREQHPRWLPKGFQGLASKRNCELGWWKEQIVAYVKSYAATELWILSAAGEEPAWTEPRAECRARYVARVAEHILDLPAGTTAELQRRHASAPRTPRSSRRSKKKK